MAKLQINMRNPFLNSTFSITYAIVWVIIIISQTIILNLVLDFGFASALTQSLIANLSFAALGFGVWFVVKYNLKHRHVFETILVFFISGAVVVSLWMVFIFIMQNLIVKLTNGLLVFDNYQFYQFTVGVFIYTILVLVYRLMILFYKYAEKARSEEKLQKLVTETKLHALKAYVNPHFLFNSLNSVNALITSDPVRAREMLINLSEYFRYSLKQKDNSFISLKEELHYTQTYFDIERQRFGEKLQLSIELCEKCEDIKVPVMILQPLFENIIKHAVAESLATIYTEFSAEINDDFLVIILKNNYDIDGISKKGTGIGLQTTYDRVSLIYQRNDLMNFSRDDGFFMVELRIPINYKD